jgi:hypothetical protein
MEDELDLGGRIATDGRRSQDGTCNARGSGCIVDKWPATACRVMSPAFHVKRPARSMGDVPVTLDGPGVMANL